MSWDIVQPADYFKQLPLFADLSAEEIVDVLRIAKVVSFKPGEALCRSGEQADCLYVVEHGEGSVRIANPDDPASSPTEVAQIGPGEIIGELALVDGQPRSADVVATTELRGYRLDRDDFNAMRAELHPAAFKMLRRIAITVSDRLRDINDHISSEIARGEARQGAGIAGARSPGSAADRASDPGRLSRAQVRITSQTQAGAGDAGAAPDGVAAAGGGKRTRKKTRPSRPAAMRADARKSADRDGQSAAEAGAGSGGFWKSIRARLKNGAAG